jgi:long-chain fatty acid transport protein
MRNSSRQIFISLAVASTLGGASALASAAGFALIEQSASGLGNAFAGAAATAEDASTVFFNPAGMSRLKESQIVVAAHAISLSAKFSGTATNPLALGGGAASGDTGGDAGGVGFVPNAYFVMPIGEKFNFGVGVSAPFGLKTEYDNTWVGRFQGINSDLKTINVNPALSYKVNDSFAVGIGLDYQTLDAELTNAVVLGPGLEGRANLSADDDAWGWNVGVLFNVTPATRIGVSYRSGIDYNLTGTTTVTNNATGAVVSAASGPTNADISLPAMFSLSVSHQLNEAWEILGDVTYTNWSTIQTVNVVNSTTGTNRDILRLNFDNSYRVSIGANYKHSESLMLKGGIAYDQTPVQDPYRTVRLPDNDRTWLAFGAKYKVTKSAAIDAGYAHLFISNASINNTRGQLTPTGAPSPSTNTTVTGSYEGSVDILSIQYTQSF